MPTEQKLHDVERQLGIRGILELLKNAGWEAYQWRNSADGRKSFLELSGMAYSDFKRTDSRQGILLAAETMLQRVQAITHCEQTRGHDFTARAGYDNGLLACRHCGFGGYGSNYARQASELAQWKLRAEEAHANLSTAALRLGVHFNIGGEILLANKNITQVGNEEGHTLLGDTDAVSFTIHHDSENGST
jgi:hypothetical protein